MTPMTIPGRRPQRLGGQIRQEISGLLVSGLKVPRIGFATITGVRVAPDLREARVFVSVLGSAEEQQQTLAGFQAARAFLRHELAERLNIRRTPDLSFALDTSAEYGAHIDELIRKTHEKPTDEKE